MSTDTMTQTCTRPGETRAQAPSRQGAGPPHGFISTFTVNGLLILGSAYMVRPACCGCSSPPPRTPRTSTAPAPTPSATSRSLKTSATCSPRTTACSCAGWATRVLYAGVGAVLGGLISVMAGYAFDKFEFRGKNSLFGFVLVGVLIPNTATVLPMYLLASMVGMTNTVWAVLIPVMCNPFGVYLARVYSAGLRPGGNAGGGPHGRRRTHPLASSRWPCP